MFKYAQKTGFYLNFVDFLKIIRSFVKKLNHMRRDRNTGCGRDRENSKVSSESEEQMQDVLIKEACP